jgi:hypothetical protein
MQYPKLLMCSIPLRVTHFSNHCFKALVISMIQDYTYLLTYLLTHSLHGAGYYLKS